MIPDQYQYSNICPLGTITMYRLLPSALSVPVCGHTTFLISCTISPSLSLAVKLCVALGRLMLRVCGLWLKLASVRYKGYYWLMWESCGCAELTLTFITRIVVVMTFISNFCSKHLCGRKNEILLNVFGVAQYFGGGGRNISKQCFSTAGKATTCKTNFPV